MTFKLTENDLMSIIRDAAMLVLEGNYHNYYAEENICYSPYRVSIAFTDHSIEREGQRYISEKDVIDDAKQVINAIIEDWSAGNIDRKTAVRVINKETCRVTVLASPISKTLFNRSDKNFAKVPTGPAARFISWKPPLISWMFRL